MIAEYRQLGKWQRVILNTLSNTPNGAMSWEELLKKYPGHAAPLRKAANTLTNKRAFTVTIFKPNTNTVDLIRLTGPGKRKCLQLGYITQTNPELYKEATILRSQE